ncbi:MAG: hypothetical protein V3U76_16870 [Granulosicoccus sp.]
MFEGIPNDELSVNRNNYSYPTVVAAGEGGADVLESYLLHQNVINDMLLSALDEDVVNGYLTIIFWGFYAGADNIVRENRAWARYTMARNGINELGDNHAAAIVRDATVEINNNNYSEALSIITNLPQSGFAFASKVCAFINPSDCAYSGDCEHLFRPNVNT